MWDCSETTLTGESRFQISTPLGIEPRSLISGANWQTTGPVELCMNAVRLKALHRAPPQQPTMLVVKQRAWNRDRKAVWDQVGLSHCWHDGLLTVRNETPLRWDHSDQSCQGHQCCETMLTGESRFHISTPRGLNPGPHDGKQTCGPLD